MDSCLPPCPLFNPRLSQNIVDSEFLMWAICKTSSKSKAYPLELNILRRTDYPLLTIRPSRTGPHSKILDTRLPMWRKETHPMFDSEAVLSYHFPTTPKVLWLILAPCTPYIFPIFLASIPFLSLSTTPVFNVFNPELIMNGSMCQPGCSSLPR